MDAVKLKTLYFIGNALEEIRAFPKAVRVKIGESLQYVQAGHTPVTLKAMNAVSGVMIIVISYDEDTYRVMYIADSKDKVYVLHGFKGSRTEY